MAVGQTHVDLAFDQGVRYRVVMPVDLDVTVRRHPCLAPFGVLIRGCRQRAQGRAIDRLELAQARAVELFEGTGVERLQVRGNDPVELGEREELLVAQARQDPAFDQEHTAFGLGLITGFAHPCRDHRQPVMRGEILVGRIQIRFITVGTSWRRFSDCRGR